MTFVPCSIRCTNGNISLAWAKAFETLIALGGPTELQPLCMVVSGMDAGGVREDETVRSALDAALANTPHCKSVRTTAGTIFPSSMWNKTRPRLELFTRYLRNWSRIKHLGHNSHGTYFSRLIQYPYSTPRHGNNQLDYILRTREGGNRRRSAYQALIYSLDDATDQRQRGFPCMQSITFSISKDQLAVNAFYPKQDLVSRGYGNMLGLCNLGEFMAHEMKLVFSQLSVFAGISVLGEGIKRAELEPLRAAVSCLLAQGVGT